MTCQPYDPIQWDNAASLAICGQPLNQVNFFNKLVHDFAALANGQAVVNGALCSRVLAPFVSYTPSLFDVTVSNLASSPGVPTNLLGTLTIPAVSYPSYLDISFHIDWRNLTATSPNAASFYVHNGLTLTSPIINRYKMQSPLGLVGTEQHGIEQDVRIVIPVASGAPQDLAFSCGRDITTGILRTFRYILTNLAIARYHQ